MQLPNSHHSVGVRLPSPMTPRIGRHRRIAGGRGARGCGGDWSCGGRIRGTACGAETEVRGGGAALRGTAAAGGRGTGPAPRVRDGVGPIPFGAGEGTQEPVSGSRYGRRIGTGSAVVSGGWRHPAGRSLRRLIGETSLLR